MKTNLKSARIVAALLLVCVVITWLTHGMKAAAVSFIVGGLAVECVRPRRINNGVYVYSGTTIADIFIPEIYGTIQPNDSPDTSAFAQSGVVTKNELLQAAAQGGAKIVEVPLWNDLDASGEPNYSDDTDTEATPGKVTATSLMARNGFMNKSFSTADLAVELGKAIPGEGNPMTRIRNRFGNYWLRQFQARLIAISRGVLNHNVATDSGDMLIDIASETGASPSADKCISSEAIVNAVFTMGDKFATLAAIAMHSVPYARLVKGELIEFLQDSKGALSIPTYLGKQVIVDDGLPVIAGTTSGFKYITCLYGTNAIGFGEGTATVPHEVFRRPQAGSGGGLEDLIERKTWLIHPAGHNWTETTVTSPGITPTLANLRLAANWTRITPRKTVPMAFLQTNG